MDIESSLESENYESNKEDNKVKTTSGHIHLFLARNHYTINKSTLTQANSIPFGES
jgi:hypothetical protein